MSVVDPTRGWTAYCFEDNLYKDQDKLSHEYHEKLASYRHYYPEPLANFKLDSTRQVEPRQYFLQVFKIRITQVHSEWQSLVEELEEVARRCVLETSIMFIFLSKLSMHYQDEARLILTVLQTRHRRDEILRISRLNKKKAPTHELYSEWTGAFGNIVSDLTRQISITLMAWDEFERRCRKYFDPDIQSPFDTDIAHVFSQIRGLEPKLNALDKEISGHQYTVSLPYEHLYGQILTQSDFLRAVGLSNGLRE